MKLQRIYALSAKTTQSPIAHLGARSYLQLDLDMTEEHLSICMVHMTWYYSRKMCQNG